MRIHSLWNDYPLLKKDLVQTLTVMNQAINITNKEVEQAIIEMIRSGGKLFRPAYLLLFSQFGVEQKDEKMISLAAAVETLHTATLIHDDIVDEAAIRRNLPTIQHSFGKDIAVYAGDYLFITCFKILANYASTMKSIQLNTNSMEKILNGELGQMDKRYDYTMTIDDYIENISGKTAELFSLSCFLGAYEGGASNTVARQAKEIGMNIGIAFQILDDILDYSKNEEMIGKPVLEDMRQGIYSLPLLLAMDSHREQIIPLLEKKEQLSDQDIQKVLSMVTKAQGSEQAHILAQKYTNKALKKINALPDNSQKTKEILQKLTLQLLDRQF